MNCAASFIKYILYFFNLIFLVCGILLIILGSVMLADMGDFKSFSEAVNTDTIPIIIIILGSIIFIISFFGCCGAIRENTCLMFSYAIFMFILFVLQLALVIWIFVKRQDFLSTMNTIVDAAWNNNDQANGYPMDALQIAFKCCGLNQYTDYNGSVPSSCCGIDQTTCAASVYESLPGCKQTFNDFWSSNINIIGYGGIAVAAIELIAFSFALCLASGFRNSGR